MKRSLSLRVVLSLGLSLWEKKMQVSRKFVQSNAVRAQIFRDVFSCWEKIAGILFASQKYKNGVNSAVFDWVALLSFDSFWICRGKASSSFTCGSSYSGC